VRFSLSSVWHPCCGTFSLSIEYFCCFYITNYAVNDHDALWLLFFSSNSQGKRNKTSQIVDISIITDTKSIFRNIDISKYRPSSSTNTPIKSRQHLSVRRSNIIMYGLWWGRVTWLLGVFFRLTISWLQFSTWISLVRLHRTYEMHTIVTDLRHVCQSVCLSVTRLNSASLCGGHSVQPLPNYFGLLLSLVPQRLPEEEALTLFCPPPPLGRSG